MKLDLNIRRKLEQTILYLIPIILIYHIPLVHKYLSIIIDNSSADITPSIIIFTC